MDPSDLERIAKAALRELGAGDPPLTVTRAGGDHDCWQIAVGGPDPHTLTVRAGAGTAPQFVRDQIFTQFSGR
jgi:hypothetical protein